MTRPPTVRVSFELTQEQLEAACYAELRFYGDPGRAEMRTVVRRKIEDALLRSRDRGRARTKGEVGDASGGV